MVTLVFRRTEDGMYAPRNPLAEGLCRVFDYGTVNEAQLRRLRELFAVRLEVQKWTT